MKLSKEIYNKILGCFYLQGKVASLIDRIEEYLKGKGVDVEDLRMAGSPYVDMTDYGIAKLSKEKLEEEFEKYIKT